MTEDRCIIDAEFTSFRQVQGRKVMQIVCEIPIEEAKNAFEKLGIPIPGQNHWVAIARIEKKKALEERPVAAEEIAPPEEPSKTKLPASSDVGGGSLSLASLCALRCKDTRFQEFAKCETEAQTIIWLKKKLLINSRSELNTNSDAAALWNFIEGEFQNYLTDRNYKYLVRA